VERDSVCGTDIGPVCWRCQGTIWVYYRVQDGYPDLQRWWHAECVSCHVSEGPIVSPGPVDIQRVRQAHFVFLATGQVGE
jgi:hypothetical protein